MCLVVNWDLTEKKAKEYLIKGNEYVIMYKVVNKINGKYFAPYYETLVKRVNIIPKRDRVLGRKDYVLGGAFHLYTGFNKVYKDYNDYNQIILKVKVMVEDIFLFGDNGDVVVYKYEVLGEV